MKLARLLMMLVLPACLLATDTKSKPAGASDKEVVTLDAYKITDRAVGSFTIAVRTMHNAEQKKTRIVIVEVAEDSDAEKSDLQVGDEIVKIDGIPVANMDPRVGQDTELGKILLNRTRGAPLDLEVITHRTKRVTLRARG